MTMLVAIYTRVSTSDQSVTRQVRELTKYIESREWQIIYRAEEFACGAFQKRPKREEVLKIARRKAIDAILVQSLDR